MSVSDYNWYPHGSMGRLLARAELPTGFANNEIYIIAGIIPACFACRILDRDRLPVRRPTQNHIPTGTIA
jgi:hypothetical protein